MMDCPACTYPMVEVLLPIRDIYTADIHRERFRCVPCGVTATVETIFEVDERPAPSITPSQQE